MTELGLVAKDRDGVGERSGVRRQSPQAQQNTALESTGARQLQRRYRLRRRRHPEGRELDRQLAEEQRVTATGDIAGVREPPVGLTAKGLGDERSHRRLAERIQGQPYDHRISQHLVE